jgi:hypothetical protein
VVATCLDYESAEAEEGVLGRVEYDISDLEEESETEGVVRTERMEG